MEFLRKSWKWVLGFIGFFVGLVWMMNSNSSRKVKKIKKNIRSNESTLKRKRKLQKRKYPTQIKN